MIVDKGQVRNKSFCIELNRIVKTYFKICLTRFYTDKTQIESDKNGVGVCGLLLFPS